MQTGAVSLFYTHAGWCSEKAMAPHSSAVAWKIPWTEEPGRLHSMGSQRVGHDWATFTFTFKGFSGGSVSEESVCNAGDLGSVPGSGRSSGEGHSNPLQDSCLENPVDRGTWWATVHRFTKSGMWLKQLNMSMPRLITFFSINFIFLGHFSKGNLIFFIQNF